jgi:hypothetical protein
MTRTMAKSVALVAALTVGLAAVTQADTIGKAIGYTKIELPDAGELKLLSVSFNSESGGSMSLSEVFGDGTLHTSPASSLADRVYIYDIDSGYTAYYKKSDALGFYVVGGGSADPTIPTDQGFWVLGGNSNPGGKTIYVAGQAVAEAGVDIAQGLNLIGVPVSKPIDLVQDIDWSQVPGAKWHPASSLADLIYVHDGGYTGYYLTTGYAWKELGGDVVDSIPLNPGAGFWYLSKESTGVDLNL